MVGSGFKGAESDDAWDDDVFIIHDGSTTGRNTKGNTFAAKMLGNQTYDMDCNWITTGSYEMHVPNLAQRTINYGEGACDNTLSVTRHATTFTVSVP